MCSVRDEPDRHFLVVIRAEINWQGNRAALDGGAGEVEMRQVEEVKGKRERKQHENKFDNAEHRNSSRGCATVWRGGEETTSKDSRIDQTGYKE